jgi:hypothetical protein
MEDAFDMTTKAIKIIVVTEVEVAILFCSLGHTSSANSQSDSATIFLTKSSHSPPRKEIRVPRWLDRQDSIEVRAIRLDQDKLTALIIVLAQREYITHGKGIAMPSWSIQEPVSA